MMNMTNFNPEAEVMFFPAGIIKKQHIEDCNGKKIRVIDEFEVTEVSIGLSKTNQQSWSNPLIEYYPE